MILCIDTHLNLHNAITVNTCEWYTGIYRYVDGKINFYQTWK